jgi:hypothetical protein
MRTPQFNIGQQFIKQKSKRQDVETIVDILQTVSTVTGECVNIEYVLEHDFCGQPVRSRAIGTTLAMRYSQI